MSQAAHKFWLGFVWMLLVWATLNALSYFVRSDGWGNLLGTRPDGVEAIGCPRLIWAAGGQYGFDSMSYPGLAADVVVALAIGVLAGLAWARLGPNTIAGESDPTPHGNSRQPSRKLQFSLRTLLLVAVAEALVLGAIRASDEARPILLLSVYLLGPGVLIAVAYRLRYVVPVQRNLAVALTGLLFIPAAAVLGETIPGIGDFTKGVLGLFIFWVPQCVLIVLAVLGWRIVFRPKGL